MMEHRCVIALLTMGVSMIKMVNLVDLGKKHYVFIDNHWFYVDEDGKILKGEQVIDGVKVYFTPYYGYQIKRGF